MSLNPNPARIPGPRLWSALILPCLLLALPARAGLPSQTHLTRPREANLCLTAFSRDVLGGQLSLTRAQVSTQLDNWMEQVKGIQESFNPIELCGTLNALAKLSRGGYEVAFDDDLLRIYLDNIHAEIASFKGRGLGEILWSLSVLSERRAINLTSLEGPWLARANELLASQLPADRCNSQDLANSVWAWAKLWEREGGIPRPSGRPLPSSRPAGSPGPARSWPPSFRPIASQARN